MVRDFLFLFFGWRFLAIFRPCSDFGARTCPHKERFSSTRLPAMWCWLVVCLPASDVVLVDCVLTVRYSTFRLSAFGFRLPPCRYWKIYAVIQAPVFVALVLTIPVVDFEEEGQRWCRPLNVMHLVTCPVFVCLGGGFGV